MSTAEPLQLHEKAVSHNGSDPANFFEIMFFLLFPTRGTLNHGSCPPYNLILNLRPCSTTPNKYSQVPLEV